MDAPNTAATGAAGHTVGNRYTLANTVGTGGMGTVWRAYDQLLRRDVAVKEVLLPPGLPAGERQVLCERTLREARAAAALNHPAVVRVYDVVLDGDRPWIVMELLQARSISEVLRDDGPMPARKVAEVGLAVLGALEAAHRVGVLHRDVKPGNVLIGADGRTTLTDFGVARSANESPLTSTGLLLGSPQYIAPERARGQAFGPPSDLWSLGATLYTAVEGRPPFDRGDPLPTMTAVVCEPPDECTFAGSLEPVLDGLLMKDPAQRWDAARTRSALKAVLSGGAPIAATGTPAVPGRSTSPARSVNTARRAITNRLANAVAQRPPAKALEGTAAMETPSFTGTQPGLPITGESALEAGSAPSSVRPPGGPPRAGGSHRAVPRSGPPALSAGRPGSAPGQPAAHPGTVSAPTSGPAPDTGSSTPELVRSMPASPARGPASGAPHASGPARRPAAGVPGTPRRAHYLESDEALRASAAGYTSAIPRSRLTKKQRWAVFAAAAVATVLLAFGGAYAIAQSLGGGGETATWTSHSQSAGEIKLVPFTDPSGYSVKVPEGWVMEWQDKGRTRVKFFKDSTEDIYLQLYIEKVGNATQQKVWEAGERRQQKLRSEYQRVKFAPARIASYDAVDWEWTYRTKSGTVRHILDRGVVIEGVSYQLYLSAPEDRFAEHVGVLNVVSESFQVGTRRAG